MYGPAIRSTTPAGDVLVTSTMTKESDALEGLVELASASKCSARQVPGDIIMEEIHITNQGGSENTAINQPPGTVSLPTPQNTSHEVYLHQEGEVPDDGRGEGPTSATVISEDGIDPELHSFTTGREKSGDNISAPLHPQNTNNGYGTKVQEIFAELGIPQYLDAFIEQGFDRWESLQAITESDLIYLGVKLGHRRMLQQRIARGLSPDRNLRPPLLLTANVGYRQLDDQKVSIAKAEKDYETFGVTNSAGGKHKCKRKRLNPPKKPRTAYLIFYCLKHKKLAHVPFSQRSGIIAKCWHKMSETEKEPYMQQAKAGKETYMTKLSEYNKQQLAIAEEDAKQSTYESQHFPDFKVSQLKPGLKELASKENPSSQQNKDTSITLCGPPVAITGQLYRLVNQNSLPLPTTQPSNDSRSLGSNMPYWNTSQSRGEYNCIPSQQHTVDELCHLPPLKGLME